MQTVLITGAAGFLGRHIARQMHARNWRVVGVDQARPPAQDATAMGMAAYYTMQLPTDDIAAVIAEWQPDAVVHAAGPASVPDSWAAPADDFHGAVGVLLCVLDALRVHAPDARVVFLSSGAVYGNPQQLPAMENAPAAPISPYGFHKRTAEMLLDEYTSAFNLPTCAVRIFSAYGPGLRRQVMWDVANRALTGHDVTLLGSGDETRDFIHATDIARAVITLIERAQCRAEVYNVASGTPTRIRDLAANLVRQLGADVAIHTSGKRRPGDPVNWCADVSRIAKLGFHPSMSLEQGVRDYARWIRTVVMDAADDAIAGTDPSAEKNAGENAWATST